MSDAVKGPIELYDFALLRTLDDLKLFQLRTQRKGVIHAEPGAPIARVDHGRWTADCACGNGMSASREWNAALCIAGCGAQYSAVQFPADADAIELILAERTRDDRRHWLPCESLEDLITQNMILKAAG